MAPTVSVTHTTLQGHVGTTLHLTQFTWPFLCTMAPTPSEILPHLGAAWKFVEPLLHSGSVPFAYITLFGLVGTASHTASGFLRGPVTATHPMIYYM